MASTSGLLEMSLQNFNDTNFNFWKEQMQDYLIVKGRIDLIEYKNPREEYKPNEWTKLHKGNLMLAWGSKVHSLYALLLD
mgnify:CR=1 FL=1